MLINDNFVFTVVIEGAVHIMMLHDSFAEFKKTHRGSDPKISAEDAFCQECENSVRNCIEANTLFNVAAVVMLGAAQQPGGPLRLIDFDNMDYSAFGKRFVRIGNVFSVVFESHEGFIGVLKEFVQAVSEKEEHLKTPHIITPPKGMKIPDAKTAEKQLKNFSAADAATRRGDIIT